MAETTETGIDPTGLRNRVASLIASSTPHVIEGVVQHLVKLETDRRTKLLIDGLAKLAEAEAAYANIKPDHRIFDESFAPAGVGYTADQKGKKEKAGKKLDRINKALTAAISESSFKDLEEVLKNSGGE